MTAAEDCPAALELAELDPPDLILLDIMMPGIDGFACLGRLREFSDVPVILLTAKGEELDKVRGLDRGADDYLTKPFGPAEMLARVRAVLRRRQPGEETPSTLEVNGLTVNLARRRIVLHGQEVRLTPTEYKLLYELATNPGRVMLHSDLRRHIDHLYSPDSPASLEGHTALRTLLFSMRLPARGMVHPVTPGIVSRIPFLADLRLPCGCGRFHLGLRIGRCAPRTAA
ncbi:MAG: response regulator transcription factor [Chloroflexota bacterium]